MDHLTTDAVVISTWEYAEGDLIASLFTRDFGKIRGMAKGALRMRSRFGAALQPMGVIHLHFSRREGQELCALRSCDIVASYHHLSGDLERFRIGCAVLKSLDIMTGEWEESGDIYRLTLDALHGVDRFPDPAQCLRGYRAKLLSLCGYEPRLAGCVGCQGDLSGDEMGFSPSLGGTLCKRCLNGSDDAVAISPGGVSYLKRLTALDMEKGQRLRANDRMKRGIDALLDGYYAHIIGRWVDTSFPGQYL